MSELLTLWTPIASCLKVVDIERDCITALVAGSGSEPSWI